MSIQYCNGKEYFDLTYGSAWYNRFDKTWSWMTTNGILFQAVESGFVTLQKQESTYGTTYSFLTNDGQLISKYYHDHTHGLDTWNPFMLKSGITRVNRTGNHVFSLEDIDQEAKEAAYERQSQLQ